MSNINLIEDNFLSLQKKFQSVINGKPTNLFFIKNSNQLSATLCNYGARMVSLFVPDKNGKLIDINVGFNSIEKYLNAKEQCYGAVVGRYAGRIAEGKFMIDGETYQLDVNNGNNAIHGGNTGFQTRVWDTVQIDEHTVEFNYVSKDGEEGYPGALTTKVRYSLTDNDELKIEFEYYSSKKTIANIINHNFYNLNGEGSGSINNHLLQIFTDKFNAINEKSIPVAIVQVKNTPFDFTDPHTMGERIDDDNIQIKNGNGYDHTYAFQKAASARPELVAVAIGNLSGIAIEVHTTEPGVHFYTGNFMQGLHTLKSGIKDNFRTAFCLETQHFPNSPNEPSAPSTIKVPGEMYTSTTIHKFFIYQ